VLNDLVVVVGLLQHLGLLGLRRPQPVVPAGAAGHEAKLIRVLKATVKGPWRGSQRPAYQRPPTTKDIRRQRATAPIFIRERAPPQGGTEAYQPYSRDPFMLEAHDTNSSAVGWQ
jgi:hypothetical protein